MITKLTSIHSNKFSFKKFDLVHEYFFLPHSEIANKRWFNCIWRWLCWRYACISNTHAASGRVKKSPVHPQCRSLAICLISSCRGKNILVKFIAIFMSRFEGNIKVKLIKLIFCKLVLFQQLATLESTKLMSQQFLFETLILLKMFWSQNSTCLIKMTSPAILMWVNKTINKHQVVN